MDPAGQTETLLTAVIKINVNIKILIDIPNSVRFSANIINRLFYKFDLKSK